MSNFLKPPCDAAQIKAAEFIPHAAERSAQQCVMLVTILGSSMAFIDGTAVNVALPALQSDLHAGISEVQWVIESYALLLTALVLVGGSLGDKIGRRAAFGIGVVIFSAASVWCGFARDVHVLILARAVQGLGAALLIPGSLALLSASFADKERGRAIGTWSGFSGITAAAGPVLGGWFVQRFSWRLVFFINVPVGIAVLILLWVGIPKDKTRSGKEPIDWRGAIVATVSLASLVYGLLELPARGATSAITLGTVIGGAVGMVLFVVLEKRAQAPMMPVGIFRSRNFSAANLLTLFLYAALSGALFFVPFNLIQVQGYSPLQAGAALLPLVLIIFLLSRWAGGLVTRFGSRLPLTIGPLIAALGFVLFAIPDVGGSYWRTYFPAVSVLGLGMAISVAPLTTTVMNSVGQDRAGAASGINNAVARLAGLLAIAILGVAMQAAFATEVNLRMAALRVPGPVQTAVNQQRSKLAAIEVPVSLDSNSRRQIGSAIAQAFVAAFRDVVLICAGLAAVSGITAALTISQDRKSLYYAASLGKQQSEPK